MRRVSPFLLAAGAHAVFNFGSDCSGGSGSFTVDLVENRNKVFFLGTLPLGLENVRVSLEAEGGADLDITLHDPFTDRKSYPEGKSVVGWCKGTRCNKGVLNGGTQGEALYENTRVVYSGYNGVDGNKGKEFIEVNGILSRPLSMGVLAYKSGKATVNYSWDGDKSPCCLGTGECGGFFSVYLEKDQIIQLGQVSTGIENLNISLVAEDDLDLSLYDVDDEGKPIKRIVGYCKAPCDKGMLAKSNQESTTYQNRKYTYSGYNGVNGKKGDEFVQIDGVTNRRLMIAAYGFKAGWADVRYEYAPPDRCRPITIESECNALNSCIWTKEACVKETMVSWTEAKYSPYLVQQVCTTAYHALASIERANEYRENTRGPCILALHSR